MNNFHLGIGEVVEQAEGRERHVQRQFQKLLLPWQMDGTIPSSFHTIHSVVVAYILRVYAYPSSVHKW